MEVIFMKLLSRFAFLTILTSVYLPLTVQAQGGLLHQGKWGFYFGNHIDWHQESRLKNNGTLKGKLYILPIEGKFTEDGKQVYRHPRGPSQNEVCGVTTSECIVGWTFKASPARSVFLYHQGVNGDDHPVWLLNRNDIKQPSVSSHFHWIANQGPVATTDNRIVTSECDKNKASELEKKEPVATGSYCNGWIIELRAIRDFAFEHGGEIMELEAGVDIASHLNMITNYQAVEIVIPPTR